MNKDWEHIREEIRKAEAPLTDDAWHNMESMLRRRKSLWWWIPSGIAAAVFAGLIWFQFGDGELPDSEITRPVVPAPIEAPDHHLDMSEKRETHREGILAFEASSKLTRGTDGGNTKNHPAVPTYRPAGVNQVNNAHVPPAFPDLMSGSFKIMLESPVPGFGNSLFLPEQEADKENVGPATDQEEKQSPLELRIYAGPVLTSAPDIQSLNQSATHKDFNAASEDGTRSGWGFDAGAELRYRIWGPLRISTGFGLRRMVTENSYDFTINEVPVIDSASNAIIGYITVDPRHTEFSGFNSYTYLNVPVSLYYQLPLNDKWSFTVEAIHHFSFLIDQESHILHRQSMEIKQSHDDLYQPNQNSYQFRLGLQYKWNHWLSLAFEPSYRSYYSSVYRDESVYWKPEDFSLNLSAIIELNLE